MPGYQVDLVGRNIFNFHVYFLGHLWAVVQKTCIRVYGCLSRSLRYLLKDVNEKFILLKNKEWNLQQISEIPGYCGKWVTGVAGILSSNAMYLKNLQGTEIF